MNCGGSWQQWMWPVGAVRRDSHSPSMEMKEWLASSWPLLKTVSLRWSSLVGKALFFAYFGQDFDPLPPKGRLGFFGWRVWEEQAVVEH